MTVVFADATASTDLGEGLDPVTLRRVMERSFDRMDARDPLDSSSTGSVMTTQSVVTGRHGLKDERPELCTFTRCSVEQRTNEPSGRSDCCRHELRGRVP